MVGNTFATSLVDLCSTDVLDRLPGRWVLFDRDFTELYSDWREWQCIRELKARAKRKGWVS
jgi:hypothetical protein